MEKFDVLRKCDMFRALDDKQLREVEKMCNPEEFGAGVIVCKQGCKEERLCVIEYGAVGIILEVGPLAQRQVQAVTDYEVFGWSAMLDPYICTATVKALEKTKVLAFDGQELSSLCVTKPEIGCRVSRGIARVVSMRLRQAYAQLLGVTSQV
ncbi:MAG: cyclic nucleotide-binding domain-containing protein [Chloroflexi bacterium]|nr:cyclic nucleotide-binding domain-containing protein [Chloroflexota bacterium]MBL7061193.1 cyclic nucleotide-binding domain-containing protein [Dehalococcoidia bacterium]